MYKKIVEGIKPLDEKMMKTAEDYVDFLAKPIGSLGKLEKIAIQLAGITGKLNNTVDKRCTVVMAADNGVYEEGITNTPQQVTALQAINMAKGRAGIAVLSKANKADIKVIDIGIAVDCEVEGLINKKIRYGTSSMAKGPAMSYQEAIRAIEIGMKTTQELIEQGYNIIGTGEMGIANTSTSSAIMRAFTEYDSDVLVGKGGGLTDEGLQYKKDIIDKAITINNPDKNDPLDVLAKVGGFDIAGLVGCYLAAAYYRVPVVIDGVISAAAAYTAYKINPLAKQFMIASHLSLEPAYGIIINEMELEPMLVMEMRLGEGTGCPLVFNIVESACAMVNNMATFDDIKLDCSYLIDIRA